MKYFLCSIAALLAVAAPAAAQKPAADQTEQGMTPFVIPWDDAVSGTATDVSFLNTAPAGANGYIVAKQGHFVESRTGKRIRFLGTNFCFRSDFPEHADAEKIAAHLAKMGVNVVRITHEDFNTTALWDKSYKGHTRLDPAGLDRLDYLIAQLKLHGIYVDLNLHVSRTFSPEDGFPDSVKQIPFDFDKRIDNYDRKMVQLQKQFARDYLTHVNPYTRMTYAIDPAVAMIEINNENTLAGPAAGGIDTFNRLPEPFRAEFVKGWNDYLRSKYRTTAALRQAWTPINQSDAGPEQLTDSRSKWLLEDHVGDTKLTALESGSPSTPPDVEITSATIPAQAWQKQLQIDNLNLIDGQLYTLTMKVKADHVRTIIAFAGLNLPDWRPVGLFVPLTVGTAWRTIKLDFQATRTVPNHSRLSFFLGGDSGVVSFSGVSLSRSSECSVLPEGQTLEQGNLDLPMLTLDKERSDWRSFLVDAETAYASEMREYLRKELKVHANIIDTQLSFGDLSGFRREADSDIADNHSYWQHPNFPGRNWDGDNWSIENTPMTNALVDNSDALSWLASYRLSGKPYTVTEYNEPAPSDYQAEMLPEFASMGAAQDWDAIFEFDYGNYGSDQNWNHIQGYFSLQGDPAKEAFMPAAALIFRCAQIEPLNAVATLHMPAAAAYWGETLQTEWRNANAGKLPAAQSQRLQTVIDPHSSQVTLRVASRSEASTTSIRAIASNSGSQYLVVGKSAVAAAGYFGGQTITLGGVRVSFSSFGNGFAALTLTPLDNRELSQSRHLLLTICGKAENTAMAWNAARTSIGRNWGHGPVQVEVIPATVTLSMPAIGHVWALDPSGLRKSEVSIAGNGEKSSFTVGPEYKTVWYEISSSH